MDSETRRALDPAQHEYFDWDPSGSPFSVHMHIRAVNGIERDIIDGFGSLPRRTLEIGGLLLGRVESGDRAIVWVEQYQPIACNHRFGPQFVLDDEDAVALENAAAAILQAGELAVVGLYRSHTRSGFQLEESDFDLIRRYFSDPSDLILLIKPKSVRDLSGKFYAWDQGAGAKPIGGEFPFRPRVITPEPAGKTEEPAAEAPVVPREPVVRRLVPDFMPSKVEKVEPAPSLYSLGEYENSASDLLGSDRLGSDRLGPDRPGSDLSGFDLAALDDSKTKHPSLDPAGPDRWRRPQEPADEDGPRPFLKKWLPLAAALLLIGGIIWFFVQPGRTGLSTNATQMGEASRPLGLYVEPAGQIWRVLWNSKATALRGARGVELFVREGDDQNRIDLSEHDLSSGSYEYRPAGNDVTFRLEVIDRGGQVSSESFRLVRATNPVPVASPGTSSPPGAQPAASTPSPTPPGTPETIVQPKATYRAPPVVAAGIRPRIKGTIPIDVRVSIDTHGRVVSAAPVTKQHSGLEEYLATRAVQAARLWRFEPARENGKPVTGTQTLHFVFTK
jgi:hypothetical protein